MDVDDPLKRLVNPDNLPDKLRRIENRTLAGQSQQLEQGSEVFTDLGDQYAGRFISPNNDATDTEPTATGFIGAFQSGNGETFPNYSEPIIIGGASGGSLKAGISNTGDLVGASGSFVVDENGVYMSNANIEGAAVTLNSNGWILQQVGTNGAITRRLLEGLQVEGGAHSLYLVYTSAAGTQLLTNGDFETGDETGWSDTDSAWAVSTTSPNGGTYSLFHNGTLGLYPGFAYQNVTGLTAGNLLSVEFHHKRVTGILAGYCKVTFKTGGGVTVSTEYIYGNTSSTWAEYSNTLTVPATATNADIAFYPGDPFNDEYIDDISVSVVTVYNGIRMDDTSVYAFVGTNERNLYEWRYVDTTDRTVGNTAAETDTWSTTVPANTLGSNGLIRISGYAKHLNNAGAARTLTIKLYYGSNSATLLSDSFGSTASERYLIFDVFMKATATNAQRVSGTVSTSAAAAAGALGSPTVTAYQNTTLATDNTSAQTLKMTLTHSAASASVTTTIYDVVVQYYPNG